jgi:hypothetical protein
MTTKHNNRTLRNAADDEPIFVLRAADNHAIDTVLHWLERADEAGLSDEKYKAAKAAVTAMEDWRTLNAAKCKNPD